MKTKLIVAIMLFGSIFALSSCSFGGTTNTSTVPQPDTITVTPSFSSQEVIGIVFTATNGSPSHSSTSYCEAKFNPLTREWVVTAWDTKADSLKDAGYVYLVDDTTGKVLNLP